MLTAVALSRPDDRPVVLLDRAGAFARGVAYTTSENVHLLNVPAGRMSADPDAPADFLDWLVRRQPEANAETFARRSLYGEYLVERLARAPGVVCRHGEAVDIAATDRGLRLGLEDGATLEASSVVVAPGNLPPMLPPGWAELPLHLAWRTPWGGEGPWPSRDAEVLLLGAGLTAVDVALSLDARGHRGTIHVLSRHGLLPRPNPVRAFTGGSDSAPPHGLRALVRWMRAEAEHTDARALIDFARPRITELWQALTGAEQRRFLRHVRPWFDVHRHRIAPEVAARLAALDAEGRLRVHAGRLSSVAARGGRLTVQYRPRGERRTASLEVALAVPCTGPDQQLGRVPDRFIVSLLASRLARPGPHGIGLATRPDGSVEGPAADRLWTLGPMRRGELWETTAIPEIRLQARAVAEAMQRRVG
jgi:uncharacterized NAD(P)/FAD-binding protein YdhS